MANHPSFTFVGNVSIGSSPSSLPLSVLALHYDSFLFAYGASRDRKLGIPGEDLQGVYSARSFVGWYNGLPEQADLAPALDSSEEAVVIGQGNVALDVARTLLSPLDRLRETDMTEEALEALSKSRVKRVRVVGRRGPLQAPYTIKEVRELMNLPGVAFNQPDRSLFPTDLKKLPRQLSRIAQVITKGSPVERAEATKELELVYMQSPIAFVEDQAKPSNLKGVTFEETEFVQDPASIQESDLYGLKDLRVRRKEGSTHRTFDTRLAFRSVGYQSEALEGFDEIGVPFDKKTGIIPNDLYGRVLAPDQGPGDLTAAHVHGMYCAGWVKRGPTGVIASTMDDAFVSADIIARDWDQGVPFIGGAESEMASGQAKHGWEAVKEEAARRNIRSVNWKDWERIDAEEKRRGKARGKEREKCKSVAEMVQILDG